MNEREEPEEVRQRRAIAQLQQSRLDASRGIPPIPPKVKTGGSDGPRRAKKTASKPASGTDALSDIEVKFKKFSKLPSELRLKVMKYSIAEASPEDHKRVVEIIYFDYLSKDVGDDGWPYKHSDHKHIVNSEPQALHQVSKEFKYEAKKKWSASIDRRNGDPYTRFDPENTIVYISYTDLGEVSDDDTMDMYSEMLTPEICKNIKHLAIDVDMWSCFEPKVNPLQKFTTLEDFTLVVHDASCIPDWDPENKREEFKLMYVDADDVEEVRRGVGILDGIDNLIDLCTEYQAKHPNYNVPNITTAIMYCDGKACCNSVESVAAHLTHVLTPINQ